MAEIFRDIKLGSFDFSQAYSEYEIDGSQGRLEFLPGSTPGSWQCRNDFGLWEMSLTRSAAGTWQIDSRFFPAKEYRSVTMRQMVIPEVKCSHLLYSGEKMGSCGTHSLPVAGKIEFTSFYTCALTGENQTLLITHPLDQAQYAFVSGTAADDHISGLSICGNTMFFSGNVIEFTPVTLSCGNAFEVLENYAAAETAKQDKKDFSSPPANGWNTWDFYRWTISENEVLKNAEFIARDPVLSKHVQRIIIDDGWQYCYGEWEPNFLFPGGMDNLAKELKTMGFTPGLWVAPAIIEPHCRIAQLEYDMLARSVGGQPALAFDCMRRKTFVLDPTVEKSRRWLGELFDKLCRWGFEYFKLDFLAVVPKVPCFADRSVPHSKLINKLMEPIVDGVDGRAEILGCNYPFMAGNRYVTNVRTGSDIHSTWGGIKANARNSACRFWTNKRLWINDPDFALCRGVDTTFQPETLQPCLVFVEPQDEYKPFAETIFCQTTLCEQQVLLSIVLMTGGAVNLSDDMTLLNEAGLDLARKVVSAESGMPAIPLDLFTADYPSLWLQKLARGGRLLVVNWQDEAAEISIPPEVRKELPDQALDFWLGKMSPVTERPALPPHSCILWQW